MQTLASLIREFPFGAFVIILASLWAGERVVTAFINRNKPECDCERDCECEDDDCDDDEGEGPAIMGGQEED
jgi:hypothetical protein